MHSNEELEQIAVFDWAKVMEGRIPELKWLYHIPNGGLRSKATAARLKAAGVKSGVPDLCFPVPRGNFHGLYIELKYGKNKTTLQQEEWLAYLGDAGYLTAVCYGAEEAIGWIEAYLKLVTPEKKQEVSGLWQE